MQARRRAYDSDSDFARVRQFLIDTYALYGAPVNWLIERWNFCPHFVVPLHAYYDMGKFGGVQDVETAARMALQRWEQSIGVWEDDQGHIVGLVHNEDEEPGEVWIQTHPDHTDLCDEMLTYAERRLADRVDNLAYVKVYVSEGSVLEGLVRARGYRRLDSRTVHLQYVIKDLPEPTLPEGFVIKSVADEDDVDKRRIAKSVAFGSHYAPSEWGPRLAYRWMQRAPDYRKDLDLFIVAPNGDYASFCTIWVDERNRYANFEPVGTCTEYQRQGLAGALLQEGFRRMRALGVERSFMDSNNPFYRKVGFVETPYAYCPWIKYFWGE